ncbi:GNAT family N-acetyltransferase [Polynucleobacter necessarius]|uniref:GNAT family N-acetyltransferase n=1 Tax=Polynucleobacter necessarius TaxID=576610 RepID=UPI000E095865|nr:GNAT family N-acetyltransferase [Polynucleobacter necessarius]
MLTTEFLLRDQYAKYGSWLKTQDPQTLHNHFGYSMSKRAIDALVKTFIQNLRNNHFLVAKIDGKWAGTMHIASRGTEVEFGVIVSPKYRKQGTAITMMDEAITWARNRHYKDLFIHCISWWNRPIQRRYEKHGLVPRNMMSDSEANLQLDPPNWGTLFKEQMAIAKHNWLLMLPCAKPHCLIGR